MPVTCTMMPGCPEGNFPYLKSGMPLAVEIPAPVKTTTDLLALICERHTMLSERRAGDAEIYRFGMTSTADHVCKLMSICSKLFGLVEDLGRPKLPSEIISI